MDVRLLRKLRKKYSRDWEIVQVTPKIFDVNHLFRGRELLGTRGTFHTLEDAMKYKYERVREDIEDDIHYRIKERRQSHAKHRGKKVIHYDPWEQI